MPRLAPGGFAWLVRHEVRLALRPARKGGATRFAWLGERLPLLLLTIVPALVGIALAFGARHLPDAPSPKLIGGISALFAGATLLMAMRAASYVLATFHDRADLDLLLAAPVPRARVLAAKATGVYAAVALPFVVLFAPFLLSAAVMGHPRWLGFLVMIGVAAVLATSLAFVTARTLFRLIGPRRARIAIQVGGAVLGGVAFLASQMANFAPGGAAALARALRHVPPPLDWPARAAFGDPALLALFVALATVAAWGAARFAAGGLGEGAATGRSGASTPVRHRALAFRGGATRVLVAKELRLLARDPELLAQILLRLVYLIPVAALVFRGDGSGAFPAGRLAAAATIFAGMLSASLAWLTVCAEDAPDLLDAAPLRAGVAARAKLIAACAPPLVIVAAPLTLLAWVAPAAGAAGLAMSVVAALTGALLQGWFGKPAPRRAFRQRQRSSLVLGVGEIVLAAAWSGVAALLARGSVWAIAPALLGATLMAGADAARRAPKPPEPSRGTQANAIGRAWSRFRKTPSTA